MATINALLKSNGGNKLLCQIENDLIKIGIQIEEIIRIQDEFFANLEG